MSFLERLSWFLLAASVSFLIACFGVYVLSWTHMFSTYP